jgi:hypothetical protein
MPQVSPPIPTSRNGTDDKLVSTTISSFTQMVCLPFPSIGINSPLDRYTMAGQWYGLPKLFPKSENLGYEVVKNDDTLIQFKNKQVSPSQSNFGSRLISSDGHST